MEQLRWVSPPYPPLEETKSEKFSAARWFSLVFVGFRSLPLVFHNRDSGVCLARAVALGVTLGLSWVFLSYLQLSWHMFCPSWANSGPRVSISKPSCPSSLLLAAVMYDKNGTPSWRDADFRKMVFVLSRAAARAPGMPKTGSKKAKMAPRWPQDGHRMAPRWPQDGPEMAPRWSLKLQDCPRWLQEGSKKAKMAPSWPQDGPKMAPRWPKEGPRSHQDGPRWA